MHVLESETKNFSVIDASVVNHEVQVALFEDAHVLHGYSHSKAGTNPELISSILYVLALEV